MSTWHRKISQSLADSVSAVLNDMKEDQKASQNKMLKKKGEPISKAKQDLPEEDEEENGNGNGNGKKNGKKLDPVNKKAVKKDFDDREDKDIDNDGDTDSSDKFLHKKRKAISKAIRNTSAKSKKVDLSGKKEKVNVNPSVKEEFIQERAQLRETLEASFDTVFQYSNKEEEAYRQQWDSEFDAYVTEVDSNAYIDPLQKKVYYIEGLTSKSAANRYLSHCIANASMAGGEYAKTGTRGGDPVASSRLQGQGAAASVIPSIYQGKK